MSEPMQAPAVSHVRARDGEALDVVGDVITVKVDGAATGGAYSCFEELTPPGGGPPPHSHAEAELFYVLEGEVDFTEVRDGEPHTTRTGPGSVVTIASHAVHSFRNAGQSRSRLLFVSVPAGLEGFFRAVGEPVADPDNPPPPAGEPDVERIVALGAQHGVQFAPPPS